MALAAALALAHAVPVQAVVIPADTVYVSYAVTAAPQGSTTICVKDKLTIRTQVAMRVSRSGNQPYDQYELTPGMYGARIQSEAQGVGSVSPQHRETRSEAGRGAIANFVFTSPRPGHATLIFEYTPSPEEDVLAPLDPDTDQLAPLVAPVRVRHLNPSPARVDVDVKVCKYEIRATSNWIIEQGFRTAAVAVLEAEVTPDDDGNFDVTVPVQDQAYWLTSFACPHTVNASESQARLQGNVTDGVIDFDVTYEDVAGSTLITCQTPVGPITGANEDTGQALILSRDDLNVHQSTLLFGSVATTEPQTLEADGTWPGAARVTVTTIPA